MPEGGRERAWRVVPADFVTAEDGTGIVHMAPAFGADDYASGSATGFPMLQPVDDRGAFAAELPLVGGAFVKEADDDLVKLLKERGPVFRSTREAHSYPHCWRCSSPLLYMARDSWFIRTTAVRERADREQRAGQLVSAGDRRRAVRRVAREQRRLGASRAAATGARRCPPGCATRNPRTWSSSARSPSCAERAGPLPEPFDPHRPFIDELTLGVRAARLRRHHAPHARR